MFTKQSDQAHIVLGVPSYPIEHPDRYALQLLSTVLGGGMSSRLFTEVRERRGLAYYVFGLNHSYTDAGSLYAQAGVDINRIDQAVTTFATSCRRSHGGSARRRAREGAQLREGPVRPPARESAGPDPLRAPAEVLEGRAPDLDEVLDGLNAVTAEDVQRVAQDLITAERLRLAVIGPFDDSDRFEALLG